MKGQHYQRNVSAVSKWCNHCGKMTMHQVNDGRVGTCLEPHVTGMSKAQERVAIKQTEKGRQPGLFEDKER